MRGVITCAAVALLVTTAGFAPTAPEPVGAQSAPAGIQSIGPLAFGPGDVLFAADTQGAAIYAFELGDAAGGGEPGIADVTGLDQKVAAVLGTDSAAITIADLVVHPRTKHAFLSVMRGQGADARPALVRVDGKGTVEALDLAAMKHTRAALPNAPAASEGRRTPRADSITDMSFANGTLIVAGLSNEEFASKLRTIAYPFTTVGAGTSVEIYHGNHGRFETRSPVYAFVPYTVNQQPHLIAGYLCTPLVKFPIASLRGSEKVVGTTIAELGNRNRPIDMLLYEKDGQDFLLMSNTSRGVMKIPTAGFATASPITSPVEDKAGVAYETIASMEGVQQMDLLDARRTLVLARTESGLHLKVVPLP